MKTTTMLKLQDIVGYLGKGRMYYTSRRRCETYRSGGVAFGNIIGNTFRGNVDIKEEVLEVKEVVPILIPISYINKYIQHDGEDVIPLLEIAQLALPSFEWDAVQFSGDNRELLDEYRIEGRKIFEGKEWVVDFLAVRPFLNQIAFKCTSDICFNQTVCFDKMNELFIDYRGLIPQGLAEAVDLDNNPYA